MPQLLSQDIETANLMAYRAYSTPENILKMPRDKAVLVTNCEQARFVDKIVRTVP